MATRKYRTYKNDKGKEEEFVVFLAHGHSKDWEKLDAYIRNKLHFNTIVSVNDFSGGIVLQKIKNAIWHRCDCAVAILSPDDKLVGGKKNARPNVIFELGYCMGFWDHYYWEEEKLEPVIIIKENSVELNSDLNGMELIGYENNRISMVHAKLKQGLEGIYTQLNKQRKKKDLPDAYLNDLAIIKNYLADRKIKFISFTKLAANVHRKYTEKYITKIIEKYPRRVRRAKLSGGIPGIKLLY